MGLQFPHRPYLCLGVVGRPLFYLLAEVLVSRNIVFALSRLAGKVVGGGAGLSEPRSRSDLIFNPMRLVGVTEGVPGRGDGDDALGRLLRFSGMRSGSYAIMSATSIHEEQPQSIT